MPHMKIPLDYTKLKAYNCTVFQYHLSGQFWLAMLNRKVYELKNAYSLHITNKVKISMASYIERRKREKGQTGFYPRHFY